MTTETMTRDDNTTEASTHWFATCALGWACAPTRDEAIEKLINHLGRTSIGDLVRRAQREGTPGLYVWTAHIDAPQSAPYKIEWFQPVGVDLLDTAAYYLTYVTKKKIAKCLVETGRTEVIDTDTTDDNND